MLPLQKACLMIERFAKKSFILAIILIFLVNAIVLLNVYQNRSQVTAIISLDERELSARFNQNEENSALSLRLRFRVEEEQVESYAYNSPSWLTTEKMRALGFSQSALLPEDRSANYKHPLRKEVLIVLEFDGKARETMLKKVIDWHRLGLDEENYSEAKQKSADKRLADEKRGKSRLFAIDAGLDEKPLRAQYADMHKYIITKGTIVPLSYRSPNADPINAGRIEGLSVSSIHVPNHMASILKSLNHINRSNLSQPRYSAELTYGKSLEPWITSLTKLEKQQD